MQFLRSLLSMAIVQGSVHTAQALEKQPRFEEQPMWKEQGRTTMTFPVQLLL